VALFEDKIGEKRVLRRNYCIAQERGGTLVDAEKWNELMYTREELTMIMLIDRIWREGASELCPKCGRLRLGHTRIRAGVSGGCIAVSALYHFLISSSSRRCNTRFRCVGIDRSRREEHPEFKLCPECGIFSTVTNEGDGSQIWYANLPCQCSPFQLHLSNCDWPRLVSYAKLAYYGP
jgi:hypothetical protein